MGIDARCECPRTVSKRERERERFASESDNPPDRLNDEDDRKDSKRRERWTTGHVFS